MKNEINIAIGDLIREKDGRIMGDKRFSVEDNVDQLIIYDNLGIDDYYHLGNDKRDVEQICELLNELWGENDKLKKANLRLNNSLRLTEYQLKVQDRILKEYENE